MCTGAGICSGLGVAIVFLPNCVLKLSCVFKIYTLVLPSTSYDLIQTMLFCVSPTQSHPLAVGIDTGCVYGGSLSALRWPARDLVSVAARYTHVNPGRVGKEL